MTSKEFRENISLTADAIRYRTWRAELWLGKALLALLGRGEPVDASALEAWLRARRVDAGAAKDKEAIAAAISALVGNAVEHDGRRQ